MVAVLIAIVVVGLLGFLASWGRKVKGRRDMKGPQSALADAAKVSKEAYTTEEEDPAKGLWKWVRDRFARGDLDADPRIRHPFLAGIVIAVLLAITVLGALDSVLAGMHFEQRDGISASGLNAGFAVEDPQDILNKVRVWEAWSNEANATIDRYSSPKTIAGYFFLIDSAFAVLIGVLLLWGVAATHRRLESKTWRKHLIKLPWLVLIGVVCDWVENWALWRTVDSVDPQAVAESGSAPNVVLLWIAKGKWLPVVIALGLLYVVLVGRFEGRRRRWAADVPAYLRGLNSVRVGLITVVLTWVVMSGPLIGEQMMDVIRRWDLFHFLAVSVAVLSLGVFAGQSTRRVYIRTATRTERFLTEPCWDPSTAAKRKWLKKARKLRVVVGWVFVFAFVLGITIWISGDTLGRGLIVPGLIGIALIVMGAPLGDREFLEIGGRRRLVGFLTPRLVAAAIPAIAGLSIFAAVVPEYALGTSRDNALLLLFALLFVAAATVLYLLMDGLRRFASGYGLPEREIDRKLIERGQAFAAGLLWIVVTFFVAGVVFAGLRSVPDLDDGFGAEALMVLGVALLTLSHTLFYLFADEQSELDRVKRLNRTKHFSPIRSPASLLPGPGMTEHGARIWLAAALGVVLTAVILWVVASPIDMPQSLGGSAVALLWVLTLSVVLEAVARLAEASAPPRMLQALGVRRTPFIALGVGWLLIMAFTWQTPGFHDEVILDGAVDADAVTANLDVVFERWKVNNGIPPVPEEGDPQVVPMIFVSAWGGGIRAAVWTSYVLDCGFSAAPVAFVGGVEGSEEVSFCPADGDGLDHVVAMSGISGGSLGFFEYFAHLTTDQTVASDDWVRSRLGADFLSPALGRLFFIDIPMTFFAGADWIDDRADVLRRSWEQESDGLDQGLLALWNDQQTLPLVIANSTSVNDACAINVSAYDSSPDVAISDDEMITAGTAGDCTSLLPFTQPGDADNYRGALAGMHDLRSFLGPDEDISLSTAALMSARFPAISPTGRLETYESRHDESNEGALAAVYTTDGGQLELSGALTSVQMWEAFEPLVAEFNARRRDYCIVPVAIHMENGFAPERANTADELPNEWLDPLVWSGSSAKGGLVGNARQRLAIEFSEPLVVGSQKIKVVDSDGEVKRFAFIRTRAHPGPTAPLGWTLSQATLADLGAQLAQNVSEFQLITKWLSGDLSCNYTEIPLEGS